MSWSDAADFLKSGSIIVASGVAIWGISAWRREHVGKKRLDTAEELLALFYQAKDVIAEIRNPGSFGSEASGRPRHPGESEEDTKLKDMAYIPYARYQKQSELFGKLKALRYRAMAQFGPQFGKPFEDLDRIISEIFTAVGMLPQLWRNIGGPNNEERNLKLQRQLEGRIWIGGDVNEESDKMGARIDAIVAEVEKIARPQIDRTISSWEWPW
jgi:hypothetical protein